MPANSALPPNVVVFFTDQQRHDTTGVHGCPLHLTPNFDRLARAGTDVHYSFTCNPVCGPARACLQTGTHSSTHGTHRNGIGLTPDLPHLAQCFNQGGYHTSYIGKWHLSEAGDQAVPEAERGGYQEWLAANCLEHTSDAYRTRLWNNDNQPVDLPGYRVDAMTDAMIRYIDRRTRDHADQPFFLFSSFLEPHHQNHVDDYPPPVGHRARHAGQWIPPDLAGLPTHRPANYEPQTAVGGSAHAHLGGYFGMVERLDAALGRIYDALLSLGILDNTIILFTSDHACHFKTRNAEYKRSCHESSIRVPTMLHGGPFTGGGQVKQLVSLLDLPPTLLHACGLAVPDTMQGQPLLPLVQRDADALQRWPDDVYIQISEDHYGRAIRTKRWKYGVLTQDPKQRAATFDRYVESHLYDLQHDPHELTNLVNLKSHSQVREVMRDRMQRAMSKIGEPQAVIRPVTDLRPAGQRYVTEAEAHA